jgi:hypothetical protein
MRKILTQKIWLIAVAIAFVIYLGSVVTSGKATKTAVDSCNCSANVNILFGSGVPGDLPPNQFNTQTNADCFGWWEFISLNWPATGDYFGKPGSTDPVQWETYITADELYTPNGMPPRPWSGVKPILKLPAEARRKDKRMADVSLVLTATTKFRDHPMMVLDSTNEEEAHPEFGPAWLGTQNGTNLWYTIHMNQDEYNYIVQNKYYNAIMQCKSAEAGIPVVFPEGQYNGPTGAVEVKSAWMEVTDPDNPKWLTYKLSKAAVLDASTGEYRYTLVALVGLHILQKTASQPQWVWTTFEHENNVPDEGNASSGGYNLYNPNCQPQIVQVPSGCSNSGGVDTIGCKPNVAPPYYLCKGAGPRPIQVTRRFPIPDTSRLVTGVLHNYIRKKYPESVWLHYKLINVLWSQTPPPPPPTTPVKIPLHPKGMQPLEPVANTTMETYIQHQTCTGCHRYASISTAGGCSTGLDSVASDFSFAFGDAQAPKNSKQPKMKKQ